VPSARPPLATRLHRHPCRVPGLPAVSRERLAAVTASRQEVEVKLCEAMTSQDWGRAHDLGLLLDAMETPLAASPVGAALWYAEQGLHVFPCRPGQKLPLPGLRWKDEATTDAEQIMAWWADHPAANVAIATGHLVDVVDYDGEQAHVAWGQRYGGSWAGLSVLGTATTPRPGGLHLYVQASGQGNRAGMVPGVDYRGLGGYVLAPPSRTEQGTYRFLRHLRVEGPPHD
jgi:hypothetical protein